MDTSARGASGFTDQTARCTSLMKTCEPARGLRIMKATPAVPLFLAFKAVQHQRPVDRSGCRLAHAVVVHVAGHADDLAPVIGVGDADALAQCILRTVPIFLRKILRDDGDGEFLVGVCPGQIAPGDQRSAERGEASWCNALEAADRRQFALAVDMILCKQHVVVRFPSMGTAVEKLTEETPGMAASLS